MENFKFKNPPILVGGKAMEFYGLRKAGDDIDYIISKADYERLLKIIPSNKYMPKQTPAITNEDKIPTDYFLRLYNKNYENLKPNAIKYKSHLVISRDDLLTIKAITAFDKNNKKHIIKKNMNDLSLLSRSLKNIK